MEACQQFSVNNLADCEVFLGVNNYLSGSSFPGAEDAQLFYALKAAPNQDIYPNISHWYALIAGFSDEVIKSWTETRTQGGKDLPEEPKKLQDGESKTDSSAGGQPKKKAKEVPKTSVLFEVKVVDTEQDLDELAQRVLAIQMDGLVWKQEYKFVEIGFGIRNLQMGCVIEDNKIPSTEDIFEKILEWEDEVQSVDIVSLQKA